MLRFIALFIGFTCAVPAGAQISAGPSIPAVTTFDQLSGFNPSAGTLAYVRDCRAIALATGLLSLQVTGGGTGCMAVYSGTTWQIDGTAIPVTK